MPELALMHHGIGNLKIFLEMAKQNGFEMIVTPISSSIRMESLENECIYSELALKSCEWNENVMLILSDDIDCDSEDIEIRKRSENTFREELNWAQYLQGDGLKLLRLKRLGNINLARLASEDLIGYLLIEVPVCNPYAIHSYHYKNIPKNICKFLKEDPWYWWHEFHAATNYDANIKVILNFNGIQCPSMESVLRWLGEPVDAVILPASLFVIKKEREPMLPKEWKDLLQRFLCIKVNIIISVSEEFQNLNDYSNYLYQLKDPKIGYNLNKSFEDLLSLSKQPLQDNLPSKIYDKYEEDTFKHELYQDAIVAALNDRVAEEEKDNILTIIMILGAGRGPLVRSVLNASEKTGRKIFIYAIEKNYNAIRILRYMKNKIWIKKAVKIVHADLRDYSPPEKADILVSDMLGSFGDNNLLPECLDSAQRFLKPDGICIPCKYTSFIYPIMSTALYNQVRSFENIHIGPYGRGSMEIETGYVTLFQNIFNIALPKPLFTFIHPNNNEGNRRYKILKFQVSIDCVLNGIAGCFDATLYNDIKMSINTKNHTVGIISWFGIYFPIKNPMSLKKHDIVEVHFWRCVSKTKVWYEWQIASPFITPIHNRGGHSYSINF